MAGFYLMLIIGAQFTISSQSYSHYSSPSSDSANTQNHAAYSATNGASQRSQLPLPANSRGSRTPVSRDQYVRIYPKRTSHTGGSSIGSHSGSASNPMRPAGANAVRHTLGNGTSAAPAKPRSRSNSSPTQRSASRGENLVNARPPLSFHASHRVPIHSRTYPNNVRPAPPSPARVPLQQTPAVAFNPGYMRPPPQVPRPSQVAPPVFYANSPRAQPPAAPPGFLPRNSYIPRQVRSCPLANRPCAQQYRRVMPLPQRVPMPNRLNMPVAPRVGGFPQMPTGLHTPLPQPMGASPAVMTQKQSPPIEYLQSSNVTPRGPPAHDGNTSARPKTPMPTFHVNVLTSEHKPQNQNPQSLPPSNEIYQGQYSGSGVLPLSQTIVPRQQTPSNSPPETPTLSPQPEYHNQNQQNPVEQLPAEPLVFNNNQYALPQQDESAHNYDPEFVSEEMIPPAYTAVADSQSSDSNPPVVAPSQYNNEFHDVQPAIMEPPAALPISEGGSECATSDSTQGNSEEQNALLVAKEGAYTRMTRKYPELAKKIEQAPAEPQVPLASPPIAESCGDDSSSTSA